MMRMIIGAGIGVIVGAVIGHFGRCSTGTCPLTSNPYIGAVFGGLIGLLVAKGF